MELLGYLNYAVYVSYIGHIVRIRNFDLSGSYLEAAVPDSDQIGKFRHTPVVRG